MCSLRRSRQEADIHEEVLVMPPPSSEEDRPSDVIEGIQVDLPSSLSKAVKPPLSSSLVSQDIDSLLKSLSRSDEKSPAVTSNCSKKLRALS